MFLGLIGLLAGGSGAALAESRMALVVGNSAYAKISPLPNPVNDARLMADALGKAGFDVTMALDVSQRDLKRAVRDFSQKLEASGPDGVGLFYYAGHGLQVNGTNYLVPVDAGIETEGDVAIETVSLNDVMSALSYSRSRLTFVVLDACRDNPYKRGFRSVQRGLALVVMRRAARWLPMRPRRAMSRRMAAAPTARIRRRSPRRCRNRECRSSRCCSRKVRIQVAEATDGKQLPWESSSLTGDFFFHDGAAAGAGGAGGGTIPPPPDEVKPGAAGDNSAGGPPGGMAADAELAYLDAIAANDTDGYRQFLADYPSSPRAEQVRRILQSQVENELWKAVGEENTVASYQRYIAAFPKGVFAEEAGQRMAVLPARRPPSAGADTSPGGGSAVGQGPAELARAAPILPRPGGRTTANAATRTATGGPSTSRAGIRCSRAGPGKTYEQETGDLHDATGVGIVRCRDVAGFSHPWCEIRYKCVTGWVYQRYLAEGGPSGGGAADRQGPTRASTGSGSYHVINVRPGDVLNVRSGPGPNYDVIGSIPADAAGIEARSCRSVAGSSDKWCIVQFGSVRGWASACCLADESGQTIR
ncbi:MAG: caspase family protein [Hyphomicrobiales bacterium]